ncbi:hypothetical protein BOX15_Mlig021371g1 [Macrostomum lignano]|uniref:Uncharacterized protein n=1 Tax=Macrostomum lignano TaxID=282301 RepID=A0A267G6L4_9PLAT|nr:hypothetical protein BOX15_Mlig021371g1 [Macrostomum lignano]
MAVSNWPRKAGRGGLPQLHSGWVAIVHRASFQGSQILISPSDGAVVYTFSKVHFNRGSLNLRIGANVTQADLRTVTRLFVWHQYQLRCRAVGKSTDNTKLASFGKSAAANALLKLDHNGNSQLSLPNKQILSKTDETEQIIDCSKREKHLGTLGPELSVNELLSLAVSLPSTACNIGLCLAKVAKLMPSVPDLLVWLSCSTCNQVQTVTSTLSRDYKPPNCVKCPTGLPMQVKKRIALLLSNVSHDEAGKSPEKDSSTVSASGILAHAFNASAERLLGTVLHVEHAIDFCQHQVLRQLQHSLLGRRVLVQVTYFRNANGAVCFQLDNGIERIF